MRARMFNVGDVLNEDADALQKSGALKPETAEALKQKTAAVQVQGAKMLLAAMIQKGLDEKGLAKQLGVAPEIVQRWLRGIDAPTSAHAKLLADMLGIPVEAWKGAT